MKFDVFEVFGLNPPSTYDDPISLRRRFVRPKQSDELPLSRKRYSCLYSLTRVPGDAPDTNEISLLSAVFTDYRFSILASRNQDYIINAITVRTRTWRSRAATSTFHKNNGEGEGGGAFFNYTRQIIVLNKLKISKVCRYEIMSVRVFSCVTLRRARCRRAYFSFIARRQSNEFS